MAVANVKVKFNCSVEIVWNIVTSLTDYTWRSDLNRSNCNSSGRSAHFAVQTVKKTKTGLELGNLYAELTQFRNSSAPG